MATLILTTVAKNAGWNAFWTGYAGVVGGVIDRSIFGQKINLTGPRLDDLKIQTSTSGTPIPKVYGKMRTECNVIWGTDFVEHKHTETQSGKGGGGSVTTTTYTYSVSFAVGICKGPITSVGRVWADGNIFDLSKHEHTIYLGTEDQMPDTFIEGIEGVGNVPAFRGLAYIVFKNLDLSDYGNRLPNFSFEVETPLNNLAKIVESVSVDMGLQRDRFDATDLSSITVPGYRTGGDKSGREQIQALQQLFVFDAVEDAGKVVFKRHDFSNVYSIPEEDLGVYESSPDTEPYSVGRDPDIELPQSLTLQYLSADNDYQQGTITSLRKQSDSVSNVTVDMQYVLPDSQAKGIADMLLYQTWLKRNTYEFTLGTKHAELKPGRIIEIPLTSSRKALAVVTKTSFGMPGMIKVSAESVYANTYTVVNRPVDPGHSTEVPPDLSAVVFEFLDIPHLPGDLTKVTSDTIYVAAYGNPYYGANIYRSTDGGVSYNALLLGVPQATMGIAKTVLQPGTTYCWDNKNTVDVEIKSGSLESRPKADVLNGYNAAILGNEIIQYTTANLVSPNVYRLSGLLRGQGNTENCVSTHAVGERFVLLSSLRLGKLTVPSSDWYIGREYRIGPATLPVTNDTYVNTTFTSNGVMARPYSPCHVRGSRDDSGNLTISWKRRTRGDGSWKDYVDVPLNETYEKYEVDIMSGSTVKRTLAVTSPTASYTAAMQTQDFGSAQSSVTIRVYQISESRGRGAMKEVTI